MPELEPNPTRQLANGNRAMAVCNDDGSAIAGGGGGGAVTGEGPFDTNPIRGQAGVAGGVGVATAATVRTVPATDATQTVSGTVTANAGTNASTAALVLEANDAARVGAVNEAAPASDIANAGLNGRLQRVAQRLTTLVGLLPPSLGQKTMAQSLAVTLASDQPAQAVSGTFWQATQPVSGTVTANAGTNASTAALVLEANEAARLGGVTEAAPASDTASSGLNGRLQRVAQRLTTLVGLLPAALGAGGGLKVDGSGTPLPVSGTFWQATQPVSGAFWQATQPVSGTVTANAGTNTSTAALGALAAATAVDAGDEATTDEAIAAAGAGTRLIGFSARETTTTAGAVFNIRAGTSNAGALLVTVSLAPNESAREWFGPDGIAAAAGVWLERVSGQTSVVGYTKVAP